MRIKPNHAARQADPRQAKPGNTLHDSPARGRYRETLQHVMGHEFAKLSGSFTHRPLTPNPSPRSTGERGTCVLCHPVPNSSCLLPRGEEGLSAKMTDRPPSRDARPGKPSSLADATRFNK